LRLSVASRFGVGGVGDMLSAVEPPGSALLGGSVVAMRLSVASRFGVGGVGDMLSAVEPPGSALLGGSLFGRAPKSNQKARLLPCGRHV
ncbi:hypothetical protein, partial [Cupriavidus alkaliphilus]|uniref:hypothetical protein n=1 Tax=Cupriavidus alkaliphilus TaxID=942866 RepID=UPI001C8436C8